MLPQPPRLIFANQLRGVAALFVIGSHLVGVFWGIPYFIGLATAAPLQVGDPPAMFALFSHPYLGFGPLGVSLFFLISGLVIPISLEQHTRGSFLLARVLRIYPTYVVALLIELAVLYANSAYWGRPVPYSTWTMISNALLIHNTVGLPSVDLVNWSLCVELKFYILMMVLAPQIRRGSIAAVMGLGAALCAANFLLAIPGFAAHIMSPDLVETFTNESTFIVFMLIGVFFNFQLRGLLRSPKLVVCVTAMLGLFAGCWAYSTMRAQFPVVTVSYFYGLGLFATLYVFRDYARPNWLLDFLARISFPLYLIHSLVGYSLMKILMLRADLAYLPSLAIALFSIICIATALHLTVELKTIALGKLLARRQRFIEAQPVRISTVSAA